MEALWDAIAIVLGVSLIALDHWSTYVGQGAVRFYLPLNVQLPNDFFAQAVAVTKGLEQRERVKAKLEKALAADFPNAVGRVYPLELGPPVGWPVQYRVSGREPDEVRQIASRVAELVGSAPGASGRTARGAPASIEVKSGQVGTGPAAFLRRHASATISVCCSPRSRRPSALKMRALS